MENPSVTVSDFQIEYYRSLKFLQMRLKRVNVVVGPNGCGKSNLYKSLRLLAYAAEGRLAKTLAEEGGIASAMWAGSRVKQDPYRIKFLVRLEGGLKYELECGVPIKDDFCPFPFDPIVKEEHVSFLDPRGEKTILLTRKSMGVQARGIDGKRITYPHGATESESVISELKEPHLFPELSTIRSEFLSWRFYHKFRTDDESPLRQEQHATRTMSLSHDASDLASALQTIDWVGDKPALDEAIDNAFPGAELVAESINGRTRIAMKMPGFHRPFDSRELSDGTLHYLCLLAALLSPRPAGLIALNEPEASIHPDLLTPLADLVKTASKYSQLWIITHSYKLAELIAERCNVDPIELQKIDGATKIKKKESDYD